MKKTQHKHDWLFLKDISKLDGEKKTVFESESEKLIDVYENEKWWKRGDLDFFLLEYNILSLKISLTESGKRYVCADCGQTRDFYSGNK